MILMLNPVKENYQWLYTSMTRAKKYLYLAQDFYIVRWGRHRPAQVHEDNRAEHKRGCDNPQQEHALFLRKRKYICV